ncbi:class I tRNA ligase family protein [Patescibacteria group bacterium]|nr:class I tRNA ligase family protein [Patescibacteria group bacterium]
MSEKEIPKTYDAFKVEDTIYKAWESSGYFNPDNLKGAKDSFTISMPPPNATGFLHVGHAVMLSVQDLVIRYQRMNGKKALWLPGTDHAAIATQTAVEKLLKKEGKTRHDLGREKFLKRVEEYVENSRDTIRNQIRKIGSSCDWSRERYTLDKGLTTAVNEAFVQMYEDGLIYRGHRIVNWCPRCHSTLADDEVEYKPAKEKLYWIKYGPFTLATARPETKLGDTAVAVHPDDPRYKKYIGKKIMIPGVLGEFEVTVVADKAVDREFGSGVIKVTPAHDFTDYEIARRHNISMKQVINEDGKMMENCGKYHGMKTRECREAIVKDMQKMGLIKKIDEDYDHNLSVCYRCGEVIEPLPSEQWFIDVNKKLDRFGGRTIKEESIRVVKNGDIKIIPERFNKTYFHWMENLRDWCISRQIWFGHRIPVWYCKDCKENKKYKMGFHQDIVPQLYSGKTITYRLKPKDFKADDQVAFENSQTKEIIGYGIIRNIKETTVGKLPLDNKAHGATYNKIEELIDAFKKHYHNLKVSENTKAYVIEYEFKQGKLTKPIVLRDKPVCCSQCNCKTLEQDPDTLDTWFSSGLWTFSTLGWPEQAKDLKTFHPTQLMETGYDILFFWVARMIIMSTYLVREVPFEKVYLHGLVRTKSGEKMSKSKPETVIDPLDVIKEYGADSLRLSLLIGSTAGNDVKLYKEKIAGYRNFVNKLWNISRYVLMTVKKPELIEKLPKAETSSDKWILQRLAQVTEQVSRDLESYNFSNAGEVLRDFTWNDFADWYLEISKVEKSKDDILLYCLQSLLKLWHPFMPFVTESIWKNLSDDFLMIQKWSELKSKSDIKIENDFEIIKQTIIALRNLRAEHNIEPAKKLKAVVIAKSKVKLIEENKDVVLKLARLSDLQIEKTSKKPAHSASTLTSGVEIYLPLEGVIDIKKEQNRLEKEKEQLEKYIKGFEQKLSNKGFVENAPKEIVKVGKEKLLTAKENIKKLEQQIKDIK